MYHLRLIVVHVSPKTYCCYVDMRVEESDIQPCPGKYSVLRSTLWERENAGAASENRTHLYTLVNITRLGHEHFTPHHIALTSSFGCRAS